MLECGFPTLHCAVGSGWWLTTVGCEQTRLYLENRVAVLGIIYRVSYHHIPISRAIAPDSPQKKPQQGFGPLSCTRWLSPCRQPFVKGTLRNNWLRADANQQGLSDTRFSLPPRKPSIGSAGHSRATRLSQGCLISRSLASRASNCPPVSREKELFRRDCR